MLEGPFAHAHGSIGYPKNRYRELLRQRARAAMGFRRLEKPRPRR